MPDGGTADRTTAPQVSVIIPAYKSAATLPAAIRSILAQTMADLEVIVVDDCSPDDVAGALAPFADVPQVRLVRHERNQGASAARNTGIAEAQGRFVAFLDGDDSWMPTKLERQLAAVLARAEPDRIFCVTRTIVKLADGHHIVRPVRAKRPDERLDEFIFVSGGFCQTSAFFVSRALAAQVGFRPLSTGEDHLFAIDLCNLGADYLLIEEPLTVYNNDIRPGRLSGDMTLARGRTFMAAARGAISAKAMAGYEARYLGTITLREHPLRGLVQIAKAVARGALPPRFAITLLIRTVIPADLYHRIRSRLLGTR